jgi:excisionase family DNA binding protein
MIQQISMPKILTVKQVADYLKVSKPTVDRRISSGELQSYKNGRLRRIKLEDLLIYEAKLIKQTCEKPNFRFTQ